MNILAIETATQGCSVSILTKSGLITTEDNTPHSHTKVVLPMVSRLLKKTKLKLSNLDAIAFDSGPGSFTGLRIGAGVAQGLALPNNTPIIKVSSLAAMAEKSQAQYATVALDARMGQVYFASFCDRQILQPQQVLNINEINLADNLEWTLVGNGWAEYGVPNNLQKYQQQLILPHAEQIAILAKEGTKLPLQKATPTYIRTV